MSSLASIPTLRAGAISPWLVAAISAVIALFAFQGSLLELVHRWSQQEEYSHGFLIPLVAAWILWSRREALRDGFGQPAWSGPLLVAVAVLMLVLGELSAMFIFAQLGFIVALIGIVLGTGGTPLLRLTFIPIAFLLFAIPLPYFIDSTLSWQLQLLSSKLGVFVIRLFQIPVYLEGNVIDLGHYKLQVVDACSGLRYLFPFMSLSFLAAYLFQAPFWQRALVFVSSIPITIGMNSLRIGIIGVTVDRWGTLMADGFLHFFEGWVIFLACAAILALEILLLARLGAGKGFFQVFYLPKLEVPRLEPLLASAKPMLASVILLLGASFSAALIANRQEIVPERSRFVTFPNTLGEWRGRPSLLEPQIEHALGLEDYILADYSAGGRNGVNLYVAYYASQRKGRSPHSPIVCIPGGGWLIAKFDRTRYEHGKTRVSFPFNRAVIEKNSVKQVVYYWFHQRGRLIANEYMSKWYLFADALVKNRTDGALVRLISPVMPGETEQDADRRLQAFIEDLVPSLKAFLPPETITKSQSASKQGRAS